MKEPVLEPVQDLRIILAEMREKNLIVEVGRLERVINGLEKFDNFKRAVSTSVKFMITGQDKTYYQEIIHLTKEKDFDNFAGGSEAFFSADLNAQFDYLSSWDKGHGESIDERPWGNFDKVSEIKRRGQKYYIYTQSAINSAGIVKEIPEHDYDKYNLPIRRE